MKYFFHFTFICIISINSCVQNNQNNATTTRPADTSAKKKDTAVSPGQIIIDSLPEKNHTLPASKSSSSVDKKYFALISAAYQDWVSGIAGGGRGTEYYFKIKITSNEKLEFDSAWINKNAFGVFISKEQKAVSGQAIKFSSGDIITLRVSDVRSSQKPNENITKHDLPIKYDGAALISYFVNGKKEFFVVKEIKKLPSVPRQ